MASAYSDYWVDHTHTIFNIALSLNSREATDPVPAWSFGRGRRHYATPPDPFERSRRVLGGRRAKRLQRHTFPIVHAIADYLGLLCETQSSMENRRRHGRLWCWGDVLGIGIHGLDFCIHPEQGTVRLATWADLGRHYVAEFSGVVVVGGIGDGNTSERGGCGGNAQKGREAEPKTQGEAGKEGGKKGESKGRVPRCDGCAETWRE